MKFWVVWSDLALLLIGNPMQERSKMMTRIKRDTLILQIAGCVVRLKPHLRKENSFLRILNNEAKAIRGLYRAKRYAVR